MEGWGDIYGGKGTMMVLSLSWKPLSQEQQKTCLNTSADAFNCPANHIGITCSGTASSSAGTLSITSYHISRSCILLRSSTSTINHAEVALCSRKSDQSPSIPHPSSSPSSTIIQPRICKGISDWEGHLRREMRQLRRGSSSVSVSGR